MLHNFCAGPAMLPSKVYQKTAEAITNYNNSGLSILEISHRSKDFLQILTEAQTLALELAGLENKGYQVLFLHGGANMQFLMVAQNLLKSRAGYIDTGVWSCKAIAEAQRVGEVQILASSKDNQYQSIPEVGFQNLPPLDYLHITTNNTIYGTQYQSIPKVEIPLIADMSSDIFSREIPYENFSLIYAGAQKNLGTASLGVVILKEEILNKAKKQPPPLLSYQAHIKNNNLFNTPPVFSIYSCLETMRWIKSQTLKKLEQTNNQKAEILYQVIDQSSLFSCHANQSFRSKMNVVFSLNNPTLEPLFDDFWFSQGIRNLKGHRTLGGYRASIYNAMPLKSVQFLTEVIQEFERKFG